MITEDYVSFETAKLLKEKGFDGECDCLYADGNILHARGGRCDWNKGETLFSDYKNECSAPTLQMTMKWLREEHSIDISVVPHSHKGGKTFDYEFVYWNGAEYHMPYSEQYPTYHELFGKTWEKYEEACEAAIKYCLKNLI